MSLWGNPTTRLTCENPKVAKVSADEQKRLLAAVKGAAVGMDDAALARRDAIRAALSAGVSPVMIAQAAGISRSRVYQIAEGV